jgi:hypothetical protein
VTEDPVAAWMKALRERHVEPLGRPAFLKAVRALSVRYVERRQTLSGRSAIDSAGKRAAFAAFFAPFHFLATSLIVQQVGLDDGPLDSIVDLGCGTGVAGAAWALAMTERPSLTGIDVNPWAVEETNWTWRMLRLNGRARRGDVLKTCLRMRHVSRRSSLAGTGIVLGWTVNELSDESRRALLPALLDLARQDASVLVVEPIARRVTPWWDEWAATFGEARGVARDENWEIGMSEEWADLARDAGFRHESLSVRSLSVRGF